MDARTGVLGQLARKAQRVVLEKISFDPEVILLK